MHLTTPTTSRVRHFAFVVLLGALVLLALAAPALAAQRPDYTGGLAAGDYPTYIGNDHTVSALRFSAAAGSLQDVAGNAVIAAGVQYYVKIRLTPNADGTPAGTDNRGFTWNPATQAWVQERSDWALFPTVSTGAGGAITAGNTWHFFRFGDTTKAGTYRVLVSLQPVGGGSGTTQNNATPPEVTVLDMTGTITGATSGFVVHNGTPTGLTAKRAEADPGGLITPVWALSRTADAASTMPLQLAPQIWTGVNAASGDFALAVPADAAFDVRLQNAIWPTGASSLARSQADVNVALGAAENTPPGAPGAVTAMPRNGGAVLTWGPASDDTAVTNYIVYRWIDAPLGSGSTALPEVAGTTSNLTFTDSGLSNGTTYHYLVRAEDAATNVGPRSTSADVMPDGTPPAPVTAFTAAAGDAHVALSWTNPADADFVGVTVVRSTVALPLTPTDGTVIYEGTGTTYDDTVVTNGIEYFYSAFAYDTALNYSTPQSATAVPSATAATTLTLTATPKIVKWGQPWELGAQLTATGGLAVPDKTVDLEASTDGGATWTKLDSLTPAAGTNGYDKSIAAPRRATQYRLVFAGGAGYVGTTSNAITVTPKVKLGTPVAPSRVGSAKFTVYGSLAPRQAPGSKTVRIKCYLKSGGTWVFKKTVTATNSNSGSASKYSARFSLSPKGSWKLVASMAATSKYAATTSGNEYLTVR